MRKAQVAPVDTMGADKLGDRSLSPNEYAYHALISLMLSAQTKDEKTAEAMQVLRSKGLSIEKIRETPEEELNEWIKMVGFHNKKAKYIKEATQKIEEQFKGKVPSEFEDIVGLPGVGPKMANILIQDAFGRVDGISVDTHVHRIANRLKWVKTNTPTQTMEALQEWLPMEKWDKVNKLLVGFGQTVCKPIGPMCY